MVSSEHMSIRPAVATDAAKVAAIYNHYVETSVVTFDTDAKSVDERVRWLSGRSRAHPVYIAEADGNVIAWGALSSYRSRPAWAGTAEAAVYVDAAYTGRGIGSRMLSRLIAEARAVGLHVLVSQIVSENTASLSMTERAGFVRVGTLHQVGRKFDRWLDVVVLELVLAEED